jgi:hypothetical protein
VGLPLVLVIDALDECKPPAEIELVLVLLLETSGLTLPQAADEAAPPQLRIYVTSRPEIEVRSGLYNMSASQRRRDILHLIEPLVVNNVIGRFFQYSLATLMLEPPLVQGRRDEDVVRRLAEKADGLFIWAATACRFIKEGGTSAHSRLGDLVEQRASAAATSPEHRLMRYTPAYCAIRFSSGRSTSESSSAAYSM